PIIAMSAGARLEDRERCLSAGMDSYLAKPVNKDALLALIGGLITDNPPLREDTLQSAVIEELATFGEDYLAQLIDDFLEESCVQLAELRAARESGDHAAVGRIAHSVRGSSSQLGGQRLARSCQELETKATSGDCALQADDLQDVELSHAQLRGALSRRSRRVRPSGDH
ncbi:MAG TPA: Hpt domain-containing protein, partial [Ardenticatenaceae bacterium]|nr:Hpt domain-containing protein [Ardenticatenaceae bacterium]